MIVYDEPDENGKNREISVTEEIAIKSQKEVALKANGYVYKNDEDALADFMTIHWAWKED
jgi:hypothetical protein